MPKVIKNESVPYNVRLCLTLQEAADYSGLPISVVKKLIKEPDCNFTMFPPSRGRTQLIKRELFEEYIKTHQIN